MLLLLVGQIAPAQADILIATNSVWKFRKGTNEVSAPTDLWRTNTFDDASWPSASAPLYAGFSFTTGTRLTDMVGSASANYTCLFMRKTFTVADPADVVSLSLKALIDDGFVMWLNGREVWRFDLAAGTVAYSSIASASSPSSPYLTSTNVPSPGNFLVSGVNVLALQAFNRAKTNADFYIAAELSAVVASDKQPPTILSVAPAPGSTVSSLSQISVTFSEPVVGVQASDMIVNEAPVAAKNGASASYTFSFSQPPPGLVAVDFDADTAITDLQGNPFDAFAANASWNYTLADVVPPEVRATTPVAGATLSALTQIEVVFTEPVTGVDAGDVLVNGQPATNAIAVDLDRFWFQFPQPAPGAVTISWASGHGIRDLSPASNLFDGTGWSYNLNPAAGAGDVVINEFLTDNLSSVADEDGQKQDWIELYNRGANAVNLLGWSLTDDASDPGKWTFPAITLNPGRYLVVYASGKDRKTTANNATNHTNFRLNSAGGYLGLYNAELPRVAISEFAPAYPEQRSDISYGRAAGDTLAYFSTLTPGGPNSAAAAVSGFALPPRASVESGFFNHPFNVALSTETPGAAVRYTLDGSPPAEGDALYTGPVGIAGTPDKGVVILRAAAFKAGLLPSSITTRTYIFPDHVLTQPANPAAFPTIWDSPCTVGVNCSDSAADYEMDPQVINDTVHNYGPLARQGLMTIPSISITTHPDLLFGPAQGVYVRREPFNQQPVNVEMLLPDGAKGFNVEAGLEIVGGTSPNDQGSFWKSRKLSMRLIFRGEFGDTKLNYKVFPDSPVESFDTLILDAGLNLVFSYNGGSNPDDQRQRAQYVRDQFVADLQNAMGRVGPHGRFVHVYLNGLYWGLHDLHERPDHAYSAAYFGGDKSEYDVLKHTSGTIVNGSATAYNAMFSLARSGLADNAVYENLQAQYLDVPWFIDYMIMNFWAGNEDWAQHNWYASRRRLPGASWRYYSWDAEHTLKGATYNNTTKSDTGGPTELFQLLRNNAEFRVRFADHVQRHFFNGGVLSVETTSPLWNDALLAQNRPAALYMKRINEIDPAIVTESARWGDTGQTGTPRDNNPLTRDREWLNELNALMGRTNLSGYTVNYFPQRSSVVLSQLRSLGLYPANQPPVFSQQGGAVPPGFQLYLTNVAPGSTIYFTTNGVDPRLYGFGAVSPRARAYDGTPIVIGSTTTVKARTLAGTTWSALNEAMFTVAQLTTPLRITEIMYNPIGGDGYEFIELLNTGATDLDLTGYACDGITFVFPPNSVLAAGARIVLASGFSTNAFAARYPDVAVLGNYSGSLDNGGERLAIKDASGKIIVSVDYDDKNGWPTAPDGGGYSLELSDASGDPDDPANWHASTALNGSPGGPNSLVALGSVVINEILADNVSAVSNGGTFPDWIELHNRSASAVDLSGWSLASVDGTFRQFVFPTNTRLNAGAYLVVWCDQRLDLPGLHTGFALGRKGESVFLYDAASKRVDAVTFGVQVPNLSVGRVDGLPAQAGAWQLTQPTASAPNLAAQLGSATSLVINEWLANPLAGTDDWIELYNSDAGRPVALSGVYLSTSNALFQITSLSFIAPRGTVQLFADEKAGPDHLDFKLSKDGDSVTLYDATGLAVDRVSVTAQPEGVSQGRLPDGSATIVSFAVPTPGAGNYQVLYTGPKLNEVMARNESAVYDFRGNTPDWIELHNPNGAAFNLSGMSLSDDLVNPAQWLFPANTVVAANSYLVIWFDGSRPASTSAEPNLNTGRTLNGDSGGVYLFNALGQLVDSVEYGFQVANLSLGRSGGQWRLLATPTPGTANSASVTLGAAVNLRINEWMAQPLAGDDWFELYNPNDQPVDLGGLFLTDDPSLVGQTNSPIAPLSFIAPRSWVKWIADGKPNQGRDHVNFSLDAEGESLALYNARLGLFGLMDAVYFGAQSTNVSQGRLPDGAAQIVSFATTPTPGEANYLPLENVVINEVLTHTDPPLEDAIEFFNPTDADADISGWFLSNSETDFKKYRIPANTIVPAHGYKMIYENAFNGGPGSAVPFTFNSAHGDAAHLSEADGAGNLTGYRAFVKFGAAVNGVSFGRYQTSVGLDFVAQSQRTLGATNADPLVGPIVMNEIMYHPPDLPGPQDNTTDEFIELKNITASPVPLFDTNFPANTWKLGNGVEFTFPSGATLPAGGHLILVSFDPIADAFALAAFRARYGVPTGVPVLGPYSGKLANDGERIELFKPDRPQQPPHPDAGFVPYLLVDFVQYSPMLPWPSQANGTGASLQRKHSAEYGNDPVNWIAATPSAGRDFSTASPPRFGGAFVNANGFFQIRLLGPPLTTQVLQVSDNLADWTSVATNSLAGGTWDYIESSPAPAKTRFYRAVTTPSP